MFLPASQPRLAPPLLLPRATSPAASPAAAVAPAAHPAARGASARPSTPNRYAVVAKNDPPSRAGSLRVQLGQAWDTTRLTLWAIGKAMRPWRRGASDQDLRGILRGLKATPPEPGARLSTHRCTSTIPGTTPEEAYAYFASHPAEVFGAAGLSFLPAPDRLEHGARLAIEYRGYPGFLSPVEVRLDPARHAIEFASLDGHFFRGNNVFTFKKGAGGAVEVVQDLAFQGSSPVTTLGIKVGKAMQVQDKNWRSVHAHLYEKLAKR